MNNKAKGLKEPFFLICSIVADFFAKPSNEENEEETSTYYILKVKIVNWK